MKYGRIIYLVLLVCMAMPMSAQPDNGSRIIEAVAKYDAGDYARAEAILGEVLAADPEHDAALYYMAMCGLARKNAKQAEEYLVKAVNVDTSNFWYRHRLASVYAVTGRQKFTIAMYEKLLRDFPEKNELYFDLVELYAATGENEKALSTLKEVETVFGMTESIAMYRYNLLLKSGRQEEAYRSLEEYNSRYSSPFVLAALAEYQMSVGDNPASLALYDEALEMAPDFTPALIGKAEVLRLTRKYDDYFDILEKYLCSAEETPEAKADYLSLIVRRTDPRFVLTFGARIKSAYESLLAAHPKSAIAAAGYGEYLMYVGKWEELAKESWKMYETFPEEFAFLEMASIGEYNLQAYDKALEACDMIIEKAPSDTAKTLRAWSMKGDLYHMAGEPKKAFKAYDNALKVDPDYVYVLNNYAYYLSMEGKKLKKACEMSRKTIEAEPDNATYLDTYGWIMYLLGDPEEAKVHFKRAMLYGGNDSPVILDHYAEVLFALGEYDKAMVYWNKALQKNKGEIKDLETRINQRKQQREARK